MKIKKPSFFFLAFSLLLSSCSASPKEEVYSLSGGYISSDKGTIRVESPSDRTIAPFNTSISGRIYYYEGDYNKEELNRIYDRFGYVFSYCHALTDRHYHYSEYDPDGNFVSDIPNVRTINESYGQDKAVQVDPYLYKLLKASYQFSLDSDGKFNRFLGALNDIYEKKLGEDSSSDRKNAILSKTTGMRFDSFTANENNRIRSISSSLPKTKEDREGLLSFDDASSSVTFHSYKNVKDLQISLGGNGKGFATEYFCDLIKEEYPDISRIISSGSSSIKAIGERPDRREWKIRYVNPCARERTDGKDVYNTSEVIVSQKGEFNLSTSGYYEQYFYSYLPDEEGTYHPDIPFSRYSHILNPATGYSTSYFDQVSVFLNDSGLADRYTTALRNTSSVKEAYSLYEKLNSAYSVSSAGLRLCYKSEKDNPDALYSYKRLDYSPLQENGLPRVLVNKQPYSGDFASRTDKPSNYLSTYKGAFSENYFMTKNRIEKATLEKEGNTHEIVSRIKEIGYEN